MRGLTKMEKENAGAIYKALKDATNFAKEFSVERVKQMVVSSVNNIPGLTVEYFEIVDDTNLQSVKNWNEDSVKVGCIAAFCGKVRLIDNIVFN